MNRKRRFISLLLVMFLSLLWGGAGCALPKWTTQTPEDRNYLYFVGVATAPSIEEGRRSAIANATTQLLEHIGFLGRSLGYRQRTEFSNRLNDELHTRSASALIRGLVLKEWRHEKRPGGLYDVYVLLRYPREELKLEKERLVRKLQQQASLITGVLTSGREEERRGKVDAAVGSYLQAASLAAEEEHALLQAEAMKRLLALMRKLKIEKISGEGQKGDLFGALPEPLTVRVTLETEQGEMPAAGVPVAFRFIQGNGTLRADLHTDDQGRARASLSRITSLSGSGVVQASIDLDRLAPFPDRVSNSARLDRQAAWDALRSLQAEFPFQISVKRKNSRVIVLIEEENLGVPRRESILGNELSAMLRGTGYTVIADHEIGKSNMEKLSLAFAKGQFFSLRKEFRFLADMIVVGTCRTRDPSRNFGWIDSAFADLHIKAISLQTGEVMAQVNRVGDVGFGENQEQAGIHAIQKISGTAAQSLAEQLLSQGGER